MIVGALVTFVLIPQTKTDNGATKMRLDELEKLGNQSRWGESIVTAWLGPVFNIVSAALSSFCFLVSFRWYRKGKTESTESPAAANGDGGPPKAIKMGD